LGLLSGVFGVCEDSDGEANFGATRALEGAALALGWDAGFGDCVSLGFPLTLEVIGAFGCFLGDCVEATAALAFEGSEGLALFTSSFSNGEPFNIDPSPVVSSPSAAPPGTAPSSLGFEGSIFAVSSSGVETGLSGLAFDGPSVAPSLMFANFGPSCLDSFMDSAPEVEAAAEDGCSESPLG